LAGRDGQWTRILADPRPAPEEGRGPIIEPPRPGERCLFVAELGHPWADAIAAAGHPVIAEAGGLAGSHVLSAGVHLLGDKGFRDAHRPERVIVLGRPTLFRAVTSLLADPGVAVDVVAATFDYPDPSGNAVAVAPSLGELTAPADAGWLAAWRDADRRAASAVSDVLDGQDVAVSPVLARTLGAALPASPRPRHHATWECSPRPATVCSWWQTGAWPASTAWCPPPSASHCPVARPRPMR
jgi:2-succinyl-5-enolpyruvyl-6-hydroxy-3-cyclohexene-1-carboxylate synthase